MNKFPSHLHGQDILFTTQFFGSLYPVNEISNTYEGAAFKLLFSLEAWHWKKERGIPPNDRRAITGPVPFAEQSVARKCNKRLPPVGLFEALPLLILKVCCEEEGRKRRRGGRRGANVKSILLFSIMWSLWVFDVHIQQRRREISTYIYRLAEKRSNRHSYSWSCTPFKWFSSE